MNNTLRSRFGTRLTAVLAGLALVAMTGCGLLDDVLGTMTLEGQVVDAQGNPVQGAEIKVYSFTDNLNHFSVDDSDTSSPDKFKAQVNLDRLTRNGKVANSVKTDAQGKYSISGVAGTGVIVTASKSGWTTDIAGMDSSDGTVSLKSSLRPKNIEVLPEDSEEEVVKADFLIVGPPSQDDGPGPEPLPPVDEEEIAPPETSNWASFTVEDAQGTVIADLTDGNINLELAALLESGGVVLLKGTHSDTSLETAFLRVQMGSTQCEGMALPAKTEVIAIKLSGGKITSDAGEFQKWYLTGGFEQLQLDADETPDSGNESFVLTVDERCAVPASPLIVTLVWDTDGVDADMHLWDVASEEHTYYSSRTSSYGSTDLDDRNGYGPEVFTLNSSTTGEYAVRIHFFSGRENPPTNVKVRVVRFAEGMWHDETFAAPLPYRDWLDLGTFKVDSL